MPVSEHLDDAMIALIQRVADTQAGSLSHSQGAAALRELYDMTSGKLYSIALRVVGNRDWAEDVLQDAYINIWRIAGSYRAALSPPLAWMGVIVRTRGLDFLRRRASERIDAARELDETIHQTVEGDAPDPMDSAQASEQAAALHLCLRRLEARQREVVSLAYMNDLSHGELAERLQLPLGTVKTWIRRGIEQLRGCMARFHSVTRR